MITEKQQNFLEAIIKELNYYLLYERDDNPLIHYPITKEDVTHAKDVIENALKINNLNMVSDLIQARGKPWAFKDLKVFIIYTRNITI